eukprot:6202780-Pleurochrysis_carterae.AAC.2
MCDIRRNQAEEDNRELDLSTRTEVDFIKRKAVDDVQTQQASAAAIRYSRVFARCLRKASNC